MLKIEVFYFNESEAPQITMVKSSGRKKSNVLSQDEFFKAGMMFEKTSKNVYFNAGEILECVGLHEGVAYFTCNRLKGIHASRHARGETPLAGIPLCEDEAFDQVSGTSLMIKELERSVASEKYMISGLEDEIAELNDKMQRLKKRISAKEKNRDEIKEARSKNLEKIRELKESLGEGV